MPDAILEARRVSFAYRGTPVLEDISLDVRPGELLGITGINGSGKTTLLKLLGGLLRPQCGEVALDGRGLHALGRNAIARRISLVPQDIPVESSFTVRDIVAMGRNPYLGRFGQETRIDRPWRWRSLPRILPDLKIACFANSPAGSRNGCSSPGRLPRKPPSSCLMNLRQISILPINSL